MTMSAVASVPKLGYELVRKRKSRGKPATMRDYAKLDFEPWSRPEPESAGQTLPPTDEMMASIGFWVRVATLTNAKTKPELVDMLAVMNDELADETMAGFSDSIERLKAMVLTLDQAYLRTRCAALHVL
jgi:hypothetical protein